MLERVLQSTWGSYCSPLCGSDCCTFLEIRRVSQRHTVASVLHSGGPDLVYLFLVLPLSCSTMHWDFCTTCGRTTVWP